MSSTIHGFGLLVRRAARRDLRRWFAGQRWRFCTLVASLTLLLVGQATAAEYRVRLDGTGDYASIQACANAAQPGDTCRVFPGVYEERVGTVRGGSSDEIRITYKAEGLVTMQGFEINHPYVTIEGFDITGYTVSYAGLIRVRSGGSHCVIRNNVMRDGAPYVVGLYLAKTSGQAPDSCVVRGNRFSSLRYVFLVTSGNGHLFENNTFEHQHSSDFVRLSGANHVFRRNVFRGGSLDAGSGGHPDFVQAFGQAETGTEDHLFEENWIQDLTSQLSQLNSGDGVVSRGILYGNVRNVTFRRNVVIGVSYNANIGMPGVRFENNTFYRLAYELSGISFGGSLTRGDATGGMVRNNVLLAGGARATLQGDASGYYSVSGAVIGTEVISVFVTREKNSSGDLTSQGPITAAVFAELKNNGYVDANGKILPKARALTSATDLILSDQYTTYRASLFDALTRTVRLDDSIRNTFRADYNFVAGSESAGFPAKNARGCVLGAPYTPGSFCEPHGINGGDPQLADVSNPLGPDGVPFTLDDGLKPLPSSPLCGRGEGGSDIGAYSCDPGKVFPNQPKAPSHLSIR